MIPIKIEVSYKRDGSDKRRKGTIIAMASNKYGEITYVIQGTDNVLREIPGSHATIKVEDR